MYTRRVEGSISNRPERRAPQTTDPGEGAVTVGRYRTPWGTGIVTVRDGLLIGVELPGATESAAVVASPLGGVAPIDSAARDRWVTELEEYFRGERLSWRPQEVALDGLGLGPFDRTVYATLLSVPPAVTVSYGVLAEMAGHPRAARAVGNAMAANPIPVVIPCHRVVRSDGSLGNYGNDPAWKERLLVHEQTHAPAGGRDREGV